MSKNYVMRYHIAYCCEKMKTPHEPLGRIDYTGKNPVQRAKNLMKIVKAHVYVDWNTSAGFMISYPSSGVTFKELN